MVVVCGLVRDGIELSRLQSAYNITFDTTFDWVEHTFVKEDDTKRDIEADIEAFIAKYSEKNIGAVFSSCDHGVAIAAILSYKLGLTSVHPKPFLLTHHKYYQRLNLAKHVPEVVPGFTILDPTKPADRKMKFPFFMKPVKSVLSSHAYNIKNEADYAQALQNPHPPKTFLTEFNKLVKMAAGPMEHDCCKVLCEELVGGEQFTVDGFVYGNDITIAGITDSIMYPGTMSFASFEYPSKLPEDVQQRVKEVSEKAILGLGITNTTFNIEYFYNRSTGDLKLIEVNPRFSGQFGDIFEKVDGTNTYDVAVSLACQMRPFFVHRQGKYSVAASFVMRIFEDKLVNSVPSAKSVEKLQSIFPDAKVFVLVEPNKRLSDYIQDTGSFRYCLVHLGSQSFEQLYKDYETCKGLLKFEFV